MNEVRLTITDCDQPDLVGTSWATDEDGNHYTVRNLSFDRVSEANRSRCGRWHLANDELWTGADWSNAMCGEAGEAANVVKKLRRIECGVRGGPNMTTPVPDGDTEVLLAALADELADVILYIDLLAEHYDVDLPAAIVRKFNRTSERQGFPEMLP